VGQNFLTCSPLFIRIGSPGMFVRSLFSVFFFSFFPLVVWAIFHSYSFPPPTFSPALLQRVALHYKAPQGRVFCQSLTLPDWFLLHLIGSLVRIPMLHEFDLPPPFLHFPSLSFLSSLFWCLNFFAFTSYDTYPQLQLFLTSAQPPQFLLCSFILFYFDDLRSRTSHPQ